jgi:hypothetical protein
MVCTTHTLKKTLAKWKGPNTKSFITSLLEAKVSFKVVVCVCDRKSFKHLFITIFKFIFVTNVRFEFGQYMARAIEGTSFLKGPMEELVFFYAYLFPCKIKTDIHNILGTKKLPTLIPHLASTFPKNFAYISMSYCQKCCRRLFYQYFMVILYVSTFLARGVVTYVCL